MAELSQLIAAALLVEIALLVLLHIINRRTLETRGARVNFALEWEGHRKLVILATIAFALLAAMEVVESLDEFGFGDFNNLIEAAHVLTLLVFMAALLPSFAYHLGLRGVKG